MRRRGDQTITLHPRRRVKATDYGDDTAREAVTVQGWSIQPMTPEEQTRAGLSVTERWKGYGPGPFPARAQDQASFAPGGPVGPDGAPARVDLDGPAVVTPGRAGHVEVLLVRRTGAGV